MDARERFIKSLQFESVDSLPMPCLFFSFHPETIRRWQREGLPKDVHVIEYLGLERCDLMPVNVGPMPNFERAELEEIEEWRLGVDRGFKSQVREEIEAVEEQFPIRQPGDWERFKTLLNPNSPARYPRFWDDYKRRVQDRDYPLGIYFSSPLSWLVEWMGAWRLAEAVRKESEWVNEISWFVTDFLIATLTRAVTEVQPDFALLREGRAYRAASLLTQEEMESIVLPSLLKLTNYLHAQGVKLILLETQGAANRLLPLWVEGGVNAIFPLEAAAGWDAIKLREQYGSELALIGNLDHHVLSQSKRDIYEEVLRKVPKLLESGGYIPAPDHKVMPEVSWENFCYFMNLLRRVGGEMKIGAERR